MMKERTAALSAVGLMLIAGCSGGGRSVGTSPSLPGGGQPGAAVSRGNATLQIMVSVAQQGPQASSRRTSGVRHTTSALRHPTWVSPYSAYVGLKVVPANGGPTYTTSFALSSCTGGYTASYEPYFNCGVSVPYGSNTFFVSMYDSSNNLLSTNLFANPAPQTVNPNGSPAANTISIYEQGVVSNIQQTTPVNCFSAGYQQALFLLFQDADGVPIFGPLANPITPNFTAYNGAGLGAIGLYAQYEGGSYTTYAVNNGFTLYDTSMYTPYFWVSGQEGAIQIARHGRKHTRVQQQRLHVHAVSIGLSRNRHVHRVGARGRQQLRSLQLCDSNVDPSSRTVPAGQRQLPTVDVCRLVHRSTTHAPYLVVAVTAKRSHLRRVRNGERKRAFVPIFPRIEPLR